MTNYRLILEYDGTDFEGWQVQRAGSRTVQGCLCQALSAVVGQSVSCTGSGRTDAGVHAEGQVANAHLDTSLGPQQLHRALNANLPSDVAVLAVDVVPDAFDARRDARSKHYRYRIWNDPVRSPLHARRSWWLRGSLDVAAIRAALPAVVGEHDFASFQATGSSVTTTIRRLTRAEVSSGTGSQIQLDFCGSGFLRYMVRNLVGTAVDIGLGRRSPDELGKILEARDRGGAGPTAPPQGLTLMSVAYPSSAASEESRDA